MVDGFLEPEAGDPCERVAQNRYSNERLWRSTEVTRAVRVIALVAAVNRLYAAASRGGVSQIK